MRTALGLIPLLAHGQAMPADSITLAAEVSDDPCRAAARTMKSCPALDHLFVAGTGKSTPAEYARGGNVGEEVIADVATWIRARVR